MSQQLRQYQTDAVLSVFDAIDDGYKRILYTQATGTGKTTVIAELCRLFHLSQDAKILCLAHRRELITQMYQRIKDHCGFDEWQIGCEIAGEFASSAAQIVVASVATVRNPNRLAGFAPDVIITDEAHRAAAASYRKIYERFGVGEKTIHIGCTATAKRTDKQSLFAINADGTRVELLDKKTKSRYPANPDDCIYEYHCFDYGILDGTEDGYLVPLRGHTVQTETDLEKVGTDTDGDFKEGELARAVDNEERTILAINAWKQVAEDRSTIVFCAGVEHAHHAAELWRQAGYTAVALDGETDNTTRFEALEKFRSGEIQAICNMGLFTEGMDAPRCGCVVHLRPTKSWNLYVQMTGRGLRPLSGIVDACRTPGERRKTIEASSKPDCIVIDLVDLIGKNNICSAPSILDLPASLNLDGETVTSAKKLLDEFEEVRERVIGECPKTFRELQVRLAQVEMLSNSEARSRGDWRVSERGFRFSRVPPGYDAEIRQQGSRTFCLRVRHQGETLLQQSYQRDHTFADYLDGARHDITETIRQHQATQSKKTLDRLTPKQINCLRANGHTPAEIDCMTHGYAKKLLADYIATWRAKQNAA